MEYTSYPVVASFNTPRIDKDAWILDIIDYIRYMEPDDTILVYDFGHSGNLKLIIWMDDDTDIRIEVDAWNKPDDGNDSSVSEVDLTDWYWNCELVGIKNELHRIWNEEYVID